MAWWGRWPHTYTISSVSGFKSPETSQHFRFCWFGLVKKKRQGRPRSSLVSTEPWVMQTPGGKGMAPIMTVVILLLGFAGRIRLDDVQKFGPKHILRCTWVFSWLHHLDNSASWRLRWGICMTPSSLQILDLLRATAGWRAGWPQGSAFGFWFSNLHQLCLGGMSNELFPSLDVYKLMIFEYNWRNLIHCVIWVKLKYEISEELDRTILLPLLYIIKAPRPFPRPERTTEDYEVGDGGRGRGQSFKSPAGCSIKEMWPC